MRYTTAVQSEKLNFRQRAVVLMKEKRLLPGLLRSNDETLEHAYELEVHQIELELQIEALFQERSVALDTSNKYKVAAEIYKDACEKYTELYDFAPSGHFTLSREGEIIELNFSGSQMLGKERLFLKNRRFGIFVSNDTKPIFNHFLTRVFHSKAKETCKVTLTTNDNLPM